jgi:mono/diheme cytochrome c family protein
MSFKTLYDSPVAATVLPCAVALVVLVVAQRKSFFARVYGTVFAIAIALDAYLNGPWTFVKPNTAWATAVGVTFVIVGDFRYFVVLEEATTHAFKLLRAVAWAFVVPVASQIVRWKMPHIADDDRATFLLYEVFFFALAAGMRIFFVPKTANKALAMRATRFELLQYGLWIAADVGLTLTVDGSAAGGTSRAQIADGFYVVRLAANLLYYVAFVPYMLRLLDGRGSRTGGVAGAAVTALCLTLACKKPAANDDGSALTFVRDGKTVATLTRAELEKTIPAETIEGFDPYYGKTKRFRGLPLARVVARGFGDGKLDGEEYVLRARDGYAVPMRGALVMEPGGYVAFEDLDVPGWQPIGPQQVSPAPYYVVWSKPEQANLDSHPRPWQLDKIEIARFDAIYPHTSPGAAAGSPEARGYELFRGHCIKCHAINREGGRVGPDLNVPQNITEYRPEDQIRAYIRNPAAFRYGNMPAHPELTDADLDALVAYLRAMKTLKHE